MLGPVMQMRVDRLPNPLMPCLLDRLYFTGRNGVDICKAVHRQLALLWDMSLRPPGGERLVHDKWGLSALSGLCLPTVTWPPCPHPDPRWETVAIHWGRMSICGVGGQVFIVPRGTAVYLDGRMALQLRVEPLTSHVLVASFQWDSAKPQPWGIPVGIVLWRELPAL